MANNKKNFSKLKSFSDFYNVNKDEVKRLGFFGITLEIDSPLYIDSKLLTDNTIKGFTNANITLKKTFGIIISLAKHIRSESKKDAAWSSLNKMLKFSEIRGTCLGYAGDSIDGHAIGKEIRETIIHNLKQCVEIGMESPEVIELLCVFTDRFGCDLSSDLITFLIKDVIFDYNEYVIKELKLQDCEMVEYYGRRLLKDQTKENDTPILLLPAAILSDLPVCNSFEDIQYAMEQNQEARDSLNSFFNFSQNITKKAIFDILINNKDLFESLLENYQAKKAYSYDYETDRLCVCKFRDILNPLVENNPELFEINSYSGDEVKLIKSCLAIFKHIIEDCGGRNHIQNMKEKGLQFLFFASSYYCCIVNNIAINPEVNHGRGPVDFFITNGRFKVSLEFKKSNNSKYLSGLYKQLPSYMEANDSQFAFFVFFDYDNDPEFKKYKKLLEKHNSMETDISRKIELFHIFCHLVPSSSKL